MTLTVLERLVGIRTGGGVERCHGIRHTGSYSNASHSWGVAVLMLLLWPEDFARLAVYCLTHDVPEAWVGDIPAPTKRYCPSVREEVSLLENRILKQLRLPTPVNLSSLDAKKLKACDILELYLWALEQVTGGNRHASCILRELQRFIEEEPLPREAQDLYTQLRYGPPYELSTDGVIFELQQEHSGCT